MVTWLPIYLKEGRHLSMPQTVKIASFYYTVVSLAALSTGWLTDSFIRRGLSRTIVRKSAMACGFVLGALAFAGCACAGPRTYLIALFASAVANGATSSGICLSADSGRPGPCWKVGWIADSLSRRCSRSRELFPTS